MNFADSQPKRVALYNEETIVSTTKPRYKDLFTENIIVNIKKGTKSTIKKLQKIKAHRKQYFLAM